MQNSNIKIQAVFFEKNKGFKDYKPSYFKKVGENKAVKIPRSEFMDLVDTANVLQPIYKDLV